MTIRQPLHVQLTEYLAKRGLLYENKSGFRGSHSTDTCLIGLTDYVRAEMGKGNLTGLVLIDLQKAFDTVDHGVLLSKLRSMGLIQLLGLTHIFLIGPNAWRMTV